MKIGSIQAYNSSASFGASIIKSQDIEKFESCLKRNSKNKLPFWNSAEDLNLWKRINQAIKNHPSDVELGTNVYASKGSKNMLSGSIESCNDVFISDSPLKNISLSYIEIAYRDFLDPANKDAFNNVMGKEYSGIYDSWWDKHIKPIWSKIQKVYNSKNIV